MQVCLHNYKRVFDYSFVYVFILQSRNSVCETVIHKHIEELETVMTVKNSNVQNSRVGMPALCRFTWPLVGRHTLVYSNPQP